MKETDFKMNKKAKFYGVYMPVFLLLLPTVVILRTVACLNYLDEFGYFISPTLITVSNAIAAAAIIFFLTYIWAARRDMALIPSFDSPASYVPCALVGVALVFLSFSLIVRSASYTSRLSRLLVLILGFLALLSVGYFLVSALSVKRRSLKRSKYGLVTLIFLCGYIAFIYFDTSLPLNAPVKIVDIMAYLFAALFFLYEIRLSLGREKWRHYISYGFMASLLCAYSSIPSLIVYFARGQVISTSGYESILTFTLFIFITLKIFLTSTLTPDKTSPVVERLIASAAKRQEELEPIEEDEPFIEEQTEGVDGTEEDEDSYTPLDLQETIFDEENDTPTDESEPKNEENTSN